MAVTVKDLKGVKISTVSLSSDLAARLRQDILNNKLRNGDKLTERVVCDRYQVSRTPVREALARLESQGFVENIPHRGAFVRRPSRQERIDDLTLRKLYEIQAVEWAVKRIDDDLMDELEETFEFMEFYTMKNDIEKMLTINHNFHRVIYRASRNRRLAGYMESNLEYFSHEPGTPDENEEYLAQVLDEHRAIYEAIKARDTVNAIKAMERHMNRFIDRNLPALLAEEDG